VAKFATIEFNDLILPTRIGTYGPEDTVPEAHVLNLSLWIDPGLVLSECDDMAHVFDYDPLVIEIDRLAQAHYHTQERLMSRIARACAAYSEVTGLEISLRKYPVRDGNGSLGVRLHLGLEDLVGLR
jgi:dihydroneopterin aldolase